MDCRLCLRSEASVFIFDEFKILPIQIWYCCGLKVTKDDGLPDKICLVCELKLKFFDEFRRKCEESEKFLKENENGGPNVDIKNDYSKQWCDASINNLLEVPIKFERDDDDYESYEDTKPVLANLQRDMKITASGSERMTTDRNDGGANKGADPLNLASAVKNTHGESSKVKKVNCYVCGKMFSTKTIIAHLKISHDIDMTEDVLQKQKQPVRPHHCNQCDAQFFYRSKLQKHINDVHLKIMRFQCEICGRRTAYSKSHKTHMKLHESGFECSHCRQPFSSEKSLLCHTTKNVSENDIVCQVCNEKFTQKCALVNHVKRNHGEALEDPSNSLLSSVYKKHYCHICKKTFSKLSNFRKHLKGVHEKRHYECDICHKTFQSRSGISVHMTRHLKLNQRFSCYLCPIKFDSVSHMQKHVDLVHLKIKRYQCSICGKLSGLAGTHKEHLKIHENKYYFQCDYCGKCFKTRYSITSHIRSHLGIKLYKCPYCERSFAEGRTLKSHIFQHTGENPFSCDLCDKKFKQRCNLKSHLRHFHKKV